jgi:hypothetical protein
VGFAAAGDAAGDADGDAAAAGDTPGLGAGDAADAAGLGASVGFAGAAACPDVGGGVFGVAGAQAARTAVDASIRTNERRDVRIQNLLQRHPPSPGGLYL